ncbi:MAG: gfo/Idh/MocA family oxidoreductase [Candidatus Omnitrophota bacterium]|nr:MAG: gfo/Idh/MocA family oxidoreductase [Candidatus Omnitrophota bacterium]
MGAGMALGLTAANYRAAAAGGANEKIIVGCIGVGGQGMDRLRGFLRHEDVSIAAVCDVDSSHLDKALTEAEKRQGTKAKGFHDFRELLEMNEIDAVTVVTPDHWHALPFIAACEAGKDVFVEKPLCHNIREGRAMVQAAETYRRITQLGTHIHNETPNYRRVVELVQSGSLGTINRVHCWKTSNTRGLGHPADCDPPKELDYNFWLGPAPIRPYNPNRSHFHFRYFWDYSGGMFIDFWCHITDVVFWALDLGAPKSVSAVGGRFFVDDNTETPDAMDLLYEYPDLILAWTVHPDGAPGYKHMGSIGAVFEGAKATLVANYSKHEIYVNGKKEEEFSRPEKTIPDSPGHIREFLDSVKSRVKTTCNIEYAYRLTKPGLLGNIAYRTGERIYWDDQKERILDNSKANRLVSRKYRRPWRLA